MAEPHLALVVSDTKIMLRGTVLVVPLSGQSINAQISLSDIAQAIGMSASG
jgi:hypothetical protein